MVKMTARNLFATLALLLAWECLLCSPALGYLTHVHHRRAHFRGSTPPDAYTSLLLHFNGTGTTVVDSSQYENVMECVNDATQSATQKKFGAGSCVFDGNADSVRCPEDTVFNISTSDFTIDGWFYFSSYDYNVAYSYWEMRKAIPVKLMVFTQYQGILAFAISDSDWYCQANVTWAPSINTWYHLACVRNGSNFYVFVDGVSQSISWGESTVTHAVPDDMYVIVGRSEEYSQFFPGYIDEFRISKGIARWTENFTPPTGEY